MLLYCMGKQTIHVSDSVKIREGGISGQWVIWTLQASGSWREYGVYESRERAELAAGAVRPRVCPVCKDGACETKSMECGK